MSLVGVPACVCGFEEVEAIGAKNLSCLDAAQLPCKKLHLRIKVLTTVEQNTFYVYNLMDGMNCKKAGAVL